MDNQNNISPTAPIIPTAGYIAKPEAPQKHEPNKKVIIIVAAILLTVIAIIAIVAIVISANQNTTSEEPVAEQPTQEPEEQKEELDPLKKLDAVTDDQTQRILATKANRILTHGDVFNSSIRATNAPVFYTTEKVSDYFNNLGAGNKMAIILPRYQLSSAPTLSGEEVACLGSESCQALFNKKDCRLIDKDINPKNYQKIMQNKATLQNEYRELFGDIEELPKQLINFCPNYVYVEELSAYVFHNHCGKSDYTFLYSYIYDFRTEGDNYYVYFTSGSLAVDQSTDKRTLLYQDMDGVSLLKKIDPNKEFTIDKTNYKDFQAYRLVFKKDGSKNYIYQKLEKAKS